METAQASEGATLQLQPICLPPLVNVDERRSLTVTDHNILVPASGGRDFSLRRVLTQIASQAGEPGGAVEMFRQLWDTQNPSPSENLGFNCGTLQPDGSIVPNQVNGFDYGCRQIDGGQIDDAATKLDAYEAVALVNRFDLAPADGSHCGEYRIVFENGRSVGSRAFLIMEAVLPNPNPSCGIAACRPVQQMWASLTTTADPATRADRLEQFYFDGISGFEPVVHYTHFELGGSPCGYGTCPTGQFRTNTFMEGPWMLKEFKLERTCREIRVLEPVRTESTLTKSTTTTTRVVCDLNFVPVSVKDNPFPDFFDPNLSPAAFVNHIDDQVACLAVDDVNGFGYCNLDDGFNHNESGVDFFASDYRQRFGSVPPTTPTALRSSIEGALAAIGSPLSAENIVARAEALSCKGCHEHTNGADLGGSVTSFPSSMRFVHNSELVEVGPDGDRFRISSGLTNTFLPFRKGVMQSYLSQSACVSCGAVTLSASAKAATTQTAAPATTISGVRAIH